MSKWSSLEIQFLKDNHLKMTTRQMAAILGRDYSTTKRQVKKYILDVQDGNLPEGFVVIPSSPIHAVNQAGDVIRIRTRKVLRQATSKKGYPMVCLQERKTRTVHRIVAEAFVPNPNDKSQVNHKDGNKLNNEASNLEWVTNDENREHAMSTGLWDNISDKVRQQQIGGKNSSAKLTKSDVLSIYGLLESGCRVGEIARKYGVNHSNISAIKSGKSWKHLYHLYSEGSTTRA